MNQKFSLIAAALLAATASSFAIEGEQIPVPTYSAVSREEVKAELRELRAAGALPENNEASPSPLEALEFDRKRAEIDPVTRIALAADRAEGDAVMERYVERLGAPDSADGPVETTTVWVPVDSVRVIESLEPSAATSVDAGAPDITQIFQHPAVTPATD
jgi:hypothetical protein